MICVGSTRLNLRCYEFFFRSWGLKWIVIPKRVKMSCSRNSENSLSGPLLNSLKPE